MLFSRVVIFFLEAKHAREIDNAKKCSAINQPVCDKSFVYRALIRFPTNPVIMNYKKVRWPDYTPQLLCNPATWSNVTECGFTAPMTTCLNLKVIALLCNWKNISGQFFQLVCIVCNRNVMFQQFWYFCSRSEHEINLTDKSLTCSISNRVFYPARLGTLLLLPNRQL